MKKLKIVFLLASVVAANLALAVNIAVIDVQGMMKRSPAVQKITTDLKKQYEGQNKDLTARQTALRTKIVKLQKNETIMTKSKLMQQRKVLLNVQNTLTKEQVAFSRVLMKAQQERMTKLLNQLKFVVNRYSKAHKIDMVLIKNAAVTLSNQELDITSKVEKTFNKVASK